MQAGVLVMLTLMLRAAPSALLLLDQPLLNKCHHYFSSAHLPILLWVFAQAARSALHHCCRCAHPLDHSKADWLCLWPPGFASSGALMTAAEPVGYLHSKLYTSVDGVQAILNAGGTICFSD